ncbi:MAG TPA: pyridoxamine 5'-phosphate oxidase family protein [Pyrinomonadaceae bacterium]
MSTPYHEGEIEVQARAGVREMAERVGRSVHNVVPPVARVFLATQRMAVVGATGGGGRVWASPLTGRHGFVSAPGESLVRVAAMPPEGDPLRESLREGAGVGLIVIDFARRMRMRFNGTVVREDGSGFDLETREVYSNCPKYIQARVPEVGVVLERREPAAVSSSGLGATQREFVTRADTFFIATAHPERGADASHRGGQPGFVRVVDERRLEWPDYSGNTMFNTLGNIAVNPKAGLLFVDFEAGRTLQVSGRARVVWDEGRAAEFAGAERVVEFEAEEVIETADALPWRWRFEGYSPFNPPLS